MVNERKSTQKKVGKERKETQEMRQTAQKCDGGFKPKQISIILNVVD